MSLNLSHAGLEDRLMLSGAGHDARAILSVVPIVEARLVDESPSPSAGLRSIPAIEGLAVVLRAALIESGPIGGHASSGVVITSRPVPLPGGGNWQGIESEPIGGHASSGLVVASGPIPFPGGGNWQGAAEIVRAVEATFDASSLHNLVIEAMNERGIGSGPFDAMGPITLANDVIRLDAVGTGGPMRPGDQPPWRNGPGFEIPGLIDPFSGADPGGAGRGRSPSPRDAGRHESGDGATPALDTSVPMQGRAADSAIGASKRLTSDGLAAVGDVDPYAAPLVEAAAAVEAELADRSAGVVEEVALELPAPIGSDLLLIASSRNAASWYAALEDFLGGVDELITGLGDFEGEVAYLPWVVGAGLALSASEAARKARSKAGSYLAYVDGAAVEPMPPA